jgi:hypothetical protein
MKHCLILLISLFSSLIVSAQVATISREQKIAQFNETAKQKANLYANYTPKPSIYEISDDFKATHKYLYAWIQDDMLRVATDALFYLCHAKILEVGTNKELASIDHQYDKGGVFSDKFLLSELRAKMPGGTKGYYQLYYATNASAVTKSRFSGRITFDQTHIVQSPNAAPLLKGPKLNSINVTFNTGNHDKEAGKWVFFRITRKPRTIPDFYNYVVGGLRIEDPAKWDEGDIKKYTVDTKAKNMFFSDFASGGNITVTNMPTDLWTVTIYIRFEFADGSSKSFRRTKTSNPDLGQVLSIDFDKDFKITKEYDNKEYNFTK